LRATASGAARWIVCWPTSSTGWSRSWTRRRWKWPPIPMAASIEPPHAEEAASPSWNCICRRSGCASAICSRSFPQQRETKAQKLLDGLGTLWRQNPNEKIVIFATYLGTVDLIAREIEQTFPGQGVVVLRGGDHGAKVAAERRFRQKDGPRVLVCTAAGREGINLQFARILFNFDLPWNPMDMEQRIGRIHRYGQNHTAQVYNLVLSDTIEGRIFLLLDEKLTEIAGRSARSMTKATWPKTCVRRFLGSCPSGSTTTACIRRRCPTPS
jgi:superfamily II DNA helicase RecQ